jgi:hypothetical protein
MIFSDLAREFRESKPMGRARAVKIRNLSAKIHAARQALAMADSYLEMQGNPPDAGLRIFMRKAFEGFQP